MTKITSRKEALDPINVAKIELAVEVSKELDDLVDKLDSFLEMRLAAEFDELREDIAKCKELRTINEVLMEENMRFRDQITVLSMQLLQAASGQDLHINGAQLSFLIAEATAKANESR